jgi:hypothetical protein
MIKEQEILKKFEELGYEIERFLYGVYELYLVHKDADIFIEVHYSIRNNCFFYECKSVKGDEPRIVGHKEHQLLHELFTLLVRSED